MNKQDDQPELDDAGIEELLQQVGGRHEPSPEVMNAVRDAVHAEWWTTVRARKRQRLIGYAMAAGVACAALTAAFTLHVDAPESVPVATVARIDGHLQIIGDRAAELKIGERVASGTTLHTDADSRAAFDFGNGVSVRADADSSFTVAAADRLVLEYGALYIDAATRSPRPGAVLKIETSAGLVQHLGTQYQVREEHQDVVVAVREGRIEVSGEHGRNVGNAGEQLHLSQNGDVQRSHVSAQDASWQWAVNAAPTFKIADQPLSAFLSWAARETGRKLVYDNATAESLAHSIKLSGSIDGLNVDAALAAVLPTTSLRWRKTADDSIHIAVVAPVESQPVSRPIRSTPER